MPWWSQTKPEIDPLIEKLEDKGFHYNKEEDWYERIWLVATKTGSERSKEVYVKKDDKWKVVMYGNEGDIFFEHSVDLQYKGGRRKCPYIMKLTALLFLPLLFINAPAIASPLNQLNRYAGAGNVYEQCTRYRIKEEYVPGYYNSVGGYVGGRVKTTKVRIPCNQSTIGSSPYAQLIPVLINSFFQ